MDLITAYGGIVKLFALIAVGYIMHRRGLISEQARSFLSTAIVTVGAPALLCANAIEFISLDVFTANPRMLALPLAVSSLTMFVSFLLSRAFNVKPSSAFYPLCAYSNSISAGLPVCVAMFGEASIPYIIIFYLCNELGLWVVGVYFITKGSGHPTKFGLPMLKNLFSPPLLGFFAGCIVKLTGVTLPAPVIGAIKDMGGLCTPLSCLYVGSFIGMVGFKSIFKIDREGALVVAGRFLISPMLMLLAGSLLGLAPLATTVLVIMAAMPTMNFVVILTSRYGVNTKLPVQMLTTTSVLMMAVVPLYLFLCNTLLY